MQTVPRDRRIEQIIDHAFEDLKDWARPEVLEGSVGPGFPEVFVDFEETLRVLREDIRRTLQALDDGELDRGFPPSTTPSINPLFDRKGLFSKVAKRLHRAKREKPLNFVGGWAIRETQVDVAYWRLFETYSLKQAALLCVGRDPRETSFDPLMKLYGRSPEADKLLYFFEDFYEALANGLGLDPVDGDATVSAHELLRWVDTKTVQIDPRFRRTLKKYLPVAAGPLLQPRTPIVSKEERLHGSTYNAHARVVGAMAKYRLDGKASVGRVAKAIVNDGAFNALGFDEKVVRELLHAALAQWAEDKSP